MNDADTFPKLLLENASRIGDRPACREKDLGIWQTWTWARVADEIRALACGLAALGFQRGDKLIIVGDNRPRLYWGMTAAQAVGGVPVPVYQDSAAKEMGFVIDHAEARFALAEDQEQVDKLLEIKATNRTLETIVYDDTRGMRNYDQAFLHDFDKVQEAGRAFDRDNPGFYDDAVAAGKGSDISVMLYTSGTTGNPKGVVLSHSNVMRTAENNEKMEGLNAKDEILAYLPMAWVGDHIFSFGQNYTAGFCVNCPESAATVLQDLRDIGPTYFFAPPRIFENILTSVMVRMEDAAPIKRRLFHYFMGLAQRVGTRILDGKPVSLADRLLYGLGCGLVYGPLKNTLGFSRIRLAYTAGEAIGPDIFDFFRALGINLKQLYGMTEASVFITVQPDGQIRPDTVGVPAPEVEVKIADNGEVLFRGPGSFQEYYKSPEATAETKDPEGWVHTGDAGVFTEDGHLKIIDRAKDVGRLNDGTLVAPKYIENKLKFFPNIKEAVAFGHQRDYVAAFINIDLVATGNWAERHNIAYGGYQELAAHSGLQDIVREHVEQVNRDLASDPQLGGSQIRRFLVLHKELDADDGELTRTRKVRRGFIADRYAALIDALYSDRDTCHVETEVTFEDGRKGMLAADLRILDAKTFPVAAAMREAS
ncbi:MAG: AMP-binding protein [Alphaproteobacteria bacterium]|nr:AMP-binding protein [Alphaproteobacteria bacterium]